MPVEYRHGADLNKCPKKVEHSASHVSIGDMHGNTLKLIYCLVEEGILSLDETSYNKLRDIYKTPVEKLTEEQIIDFKKIVNGAQVNKDIALTLIGDELADRGNNDYFTLLVLKKLRESGVNFDVMLSNHSAAFIKDYDRSTFTGQDGFAPGQGQSLNNMHRLIDKGIISEEEVRGLVIDYYVPSVKAINYTVTKDGELTLFSHAPVGLETIKALATYFKIPYDDYSQKALINTIDTINAHVNELFKQKKLGEAIESAFIDGPYSHEQVMRQCYQAMGGMEVPIPPQAPLQRLVWNRYVTHPDQIEIIPSGNFKVRFVHGHIGPEPFSLDSWPLPSHENLDSYFGKNEQLFKAGAGVYHLVRHSNELTAHELQQDPQFLKKFYLKNLDRLMKELHEKVDDLEVKADPNNAFYDANYVKAATAARKLITTIDTAREEFAKNINTESLDSFIKACDTAITAAEPVLGEHRGIMGVVEKVATLLNRLFTVITFGIFRDNSQGFLESTKVKIDTDSMAKAKNFKAELENFKHGYEEEFQDKESPSPG